MYHKSEVTKELLQNIDIIIDGQFEIENKMVDLAFRGSTNQRKIDVQKSLEKGEMVRLKFGDESRYESKKPKIMYFEEFKKEEKVLTKVPENNTIPVNFIAIENLDNTESKPIIEIEEKEIIAAKNIE